MKKWIFLLFLILSACGGQREIIRVGEGQTAPSQPTGSKDSVGGADVGGGNAIQGRMIEEYVIRLPDILEYQESIFPIINLLKIHFPDLAADFLHIVESRKWYSVPVDLKTLDALKIGIPFGFATEQAALHMPEKIFIDKRIWDTMTSSSRSYLLLHEIVMGVKWLSNHEDLEKCLARAKRFLVDSGFIESSNYRDANRMCYKKYPRYFTVPTKFKLSPQDYDSIRDIVDRLSKADEKTDWESFILWFNSRSFRTYEPHEGK